MTAPGDPTFLVITPLSGRTALTLTPYSARGLMQTLEPITSIQGSGGNALGTLIRRDINGNLVDLTFPQFRKYASTITCNDQDTPAMDGAFLGEIVQVDCAAELNYPTLGGSPQRTEVPSSSRTEGLFTFYRPRLLMMITGIKRSWDEWGAVNSWTISLQEI